MSVLEAEPGPRAYQSGNLEFGTNPLLGGPKKQKQRQSPKGPKSKRSLPQRRIFVSYRIIIGMVALLNYKNRSAPLHGGDGGTLLVPSGSAAACLVELHLHSHPGP